MRYQWIIFDADGTLFDYDRAESSALQLAFEHFGYDYNPDYLEIYRKCNKKLWDAFELGDIEINTLKVKRFELFLYEIGASINAGKFSQQYLHQLSASTYLIDGAEALLNSLAGKVGLILMTNGIKEVQRSRLGNSAIESYFSDIIISDEVGVAKPNKKIFEIALENMSIKDKSTVLMVGDNLSSDIKGGIDFGIDTCWYNPNQIETNPDIRATYEVIDFEDLQAIIQK
jgi:putative hydrolase of the HAD superfamily